MHQNSTWLVSQTIAKGLSYGIILGSAIIKIPQIVKIMQKKSVFGISFGSTIFELLTLILTIAYNINRDNPFSIYGYAALISLQIFLITFLFILYSKQNHKTISLVIFILLLLAWASLNPWLFPPYIIDNSILLSTIFLFVARLMQIIHIHYVRSTGNLALSTCLLTVVGNIARLISVLVEAADQWKYLFSCVLAFTLNCYILWLFWYFRSSKTPAKPATAATASKKGSVLSPQLYSARPQATDKSAMYK